MFHRGTVTAWIGVLVLSGMFLMGQESWSPPPQTNLSGYYQVEIEFDNGYSGFGEAAFFQEGTSIRGVLVRASGDFVDPNGFTLDNGHIVDTDRFVGNGIVPASNIGCSWNVTVTSNGSLYGTVMLDNGLEAYIQGYRLSGTFTTGNAISGYFQTDIDFQNGYSGIGRGCFVQVGTSVHGVLLRISGSFVTPHGFTLVDGVAFSANEFTGPGSTFPTAEEVNWQVGISGDGTLTGSVLVGNGLEALLSGHRL